MRSLYTANFHGNDGGGITTYIVNLARALAGRHEVVVAAPERTRLYQAARQIPGVEVVALEFRNSLKSMLSAGSKLRQMISGRGFDVVHVNGSADHRIVMLAAAGLGKKRPAIVYTRHHDLPTRGLMQTLKARCATDVVICISTYMRDILAKTSFGHCSLQVVGHGLDLDWYSPASTEATAAARRTWLAGAPEDTLLIASNAGTGIFKRWIDMVSAVALLDDASRSKIRILVAGVMPPADQLQQVEALGMAQQVIFTGLIEDVRPMVAACDLGFVLSSRETLSFACREMMAMGKPVLVSRVGGLPENITDGVNGWVVPEGAPDQIANILRSVLADRSQLHTMGAAAHAHSQQFFSLQRFAVDTESVYGDAVRLCRLQT